MANFGTVLIKNFIGGIAVWYLISNSLYAQVHAQAHPQDCKQLGEAVLSSATAKEITKRFRVFVRSCHPDKYVAPNEELNKQNYELYLKVNDYYNQFAEKSRTSEAGSGIAMPWFPKAATFKDILNALADKYGKDNWNLFANVLNYRGPDDLAKIETLLDNGANPNFMHPMRGSTVLTEAAYQGDPRLVGLLLDYGAGTSVNSKGESDKTALRGAALRCSAEIVELLLNAGADINLTAGFFDTTPLEEAITASCPDVVKLLLNRGAAIKPEDVDLAIKYFGFSKEEDTPPHIREARKLVLDIIRDSVKKLGHVHEEL